MKRFTASVLFLFCLVPAFALGGCSGHSPAVSLGFGTHGAGIGFHSGGHDAPYMGGFYSPHHSGVHVGVPIAPGNAAEWEEGSFTPPENQGWQASPESVPAPAAPPEN